MAKVAALEQAVRYQNHHWQAPVVVATATNGDDVTNPNIGLNRDGDGAAVWFARNSLAKTVQLKAFKDGVWSDDLATVATLTAATNIGSSAPIVKSDACDHLVVSWIAIPQHLEEHLFLPLLGRDKNAYFYASHLYNFHVDKQGKHMYMQEKRKDNLISFVPTQ